MPPYILQALTNSGEKYQACIDAPNEEDLINAAHSRGYYPLRVRLSKNPSGAITLQQFLDTPTPFLNIQRQRQQNLETLNKTKALVERILAGDDDALDALHDHLREEVEPIAVDPDHELNAVARTFLESFGPPLTPAKLRENHRIAVRRQAEIDEKIARGDVPAFLAADPFLIAEGKWIDEKRQQIPAQLFLLDQEMLYVILDPDRSPRLQRLAQVSQLSRCALVWGCLRKQWVLEFSNGDQWSLVLERVDRSQRSKLKSRERLLNTIIRHPA